MIQASVVTPPIQPMAHASRPIVWGLVATELHDAYWRAHGVQCIRRGCKQPLQSGVDLFLLIEQDQLVLFDLPSLADHLAWRDATVTRLRVVGLEDPPYPERVDVDEQGLVRRVARRYQPQTNSAYRVLLTRKPRIARACMSAVVRGTGWRTIRGMARPSNVDHLRCVGGCYIAGDRGDEIRMITRLVETWRHPDAAIDGLKEIREAVWINSETDFAHDAIVIGPAWIGRNVEIGAEMCLVGPTWVPDEDRSATESVRGANLRDINDIEPQEIERHPEPPTRSRVGYAVAKRLLDILGSIFGLLLTSPLIAFIALWILIDDGRPVFFGDVRQSRGGRLFKCWKFRTMYRNADAIKRELEQQNVCDGPQFFVEDDPRVTGVGKFLRRYHLDELPQLWNVVRGQMSLVGPRPSPDDENQFCPSWRELRLSVRPGMTGLWQLKRTRAPGLDFQEWIRYDTEYVKHAGLWLDMKILIQTIWIVCLKGLRHAAHYAR